MKDGEDVVRSLIQTDKPLGDVSVRARIQKGGVLIEGHRNEKLILAVTLRHPSQGTQQQTVIRNFTVDLQPGPIDKSVLNALITRLNASTHTLPWAKRPKSKKGLPEQELIKLRDTLELAKYKIVVGQKKAGIELLNGLPSKLPPGMIIDRAIAYHSVNMRDDMERVLESGKLQGQYIEAANLLRNKQGSLQSTIDTLTPKNACRFLSVLDVLNALNRHDDLLSLAQAMRKKDPECAGAWDAEFNEHTRRKDLDSALQVAETAYQADPKDRLTRLRYGSARQRREEFAQAATIYEAIARDFPNEQGILRLTLGVMLRDIPGRKAHKERLSKRLASDSKDIVSQFLRGVLHHYENEFEASNTLLRPLEERLSYEQRIDIYLAMNDFNTGRKAEALKRLDRAAQAPIPDPDVFYCRAEILRDERREQAISDLERYLATSERSLVSNPGKQIRVKKLRDDLVNCLKNGTKKCESEWEHPRHLIAAKTPNSSIRTEEERNYWPYAGLLLLVVVTLIVWRKRLTS